MTERPEKGSDSRRGGQAGSVSALVKEFAALQRLARQLQQRAAEGDIHALHGILSRREAVLASIRKSVVALEENHRSEEGSPAPDLDDKTRQEIAQRLRDVAGLDAASRQILEERAAAIAAEIQKIKAGRKWRESSGNEY